MPVFCLESNNTIKHMKNNGISIRRFPFPFRSALTICSDIDSTDTLKEFLTIQEFLNTKNDTVLGQGVGLEIGNSFYPQNNDPAKFALLSKNLHDKEVLYDLFNLGYVDCIHSFNSAKDRDEINNIVSEIRHNNSRFDVWVNHANVKNNIGSCERCFGDKKKSPHYHTDLSIKELGYKFVWTDIVTSIIGQGCPLTISSFFASLDRRHPATSMYEVVFKEIIKYLLSPFITKYNNRRFNELVYPAVLSDGQRVFNFARSDVFYKGIGPGATAAGLANNLRAQVLKRLNHVNGCMIIYCHIGKNDGYPYLPEETCQALRLLENEHRQGNIFVTTTARLLTYYVNNKFLQWRVETRGRKIEIHIDSISDPVRGSFTPTLEDLGGMTFYSDQPDNTDIYLSKQLVPDIIVNNQDVTGKRSVMIPLQPLPKLDDKMKEYKQKGYF